MARAIFQKNQRVFVKPVGTWALVERVVPHWTKGLSEPIRIHYDVGLGRDFASDELRSERSFADNAPEDGVEEWRIVRARNKWQSAEETSHHPYPGTYPVLVTGESEWGGWRVPGAEYALSPTRIERQARMITATPRMTAIIKKLSEWASRTPNEVPHALADLTKDIQDVSEFLDEIAEG